jgi:hypothetical protein
MSKPVTLFALALFLLSTATTTSNSQEPSKTGQQHYVVLRRGPIEAVVVDNSAINDSILPGHRAGYHGLGSLKHTEQRRNLFVPAYAGLNFEHIHDGTMQTREILFEPRSAAMELRAVNEFTAELHQPPTPHWGLESWMRYELLENGVIEMSFSCVPRRATWKNPYLGLFWASYIDSPESLDIHLVGSGPDQPWIIGKTPAHGVLATHRALGDDREFANDPDFPLTLVFNYSASYYSQPWFFGVCRGMAFAQIFRAQDVIRFSQSPSGGGTGNPAWDFQYLISEPKVGQRYEIAMRALYAAFNSGKGEAAAKNEFRTRISRAAFVESSSPGPKQP